MKKTPIFKSDRSLRSKVNYRNNKNISTFNAQSKVNSNQTDKNFS